MWSRLKISFVILSLLAIVSSCPAQNATADEQQRVEDAANKVLERFYARLDFGEIWKNDATSNQAIRRAEVYVVMRQLLWDSKVRIPFAEQERAYIAKQNFYLLLSAVRYTNPEMFRSSEFEAELKEPYESVSQIKRPIVSAEDLEVRFTRVMNRMSELLRKRVKPSVYNSDGYKADVTRIAEDNQDERARLIDILGLNPKTKIWVARREIYYLYFIEEGNVLKLLTLSSRLRD